jgi:hypothetical protein
VIPHGHIGVSIILKRCKYNLTLSCPVTMVVCMYVCMYVCKCVSMHVRVDVRITNGKVVSVHDREDAYGDKTKMETSGHLHVPITSRPR